MSDDFQCINLNTNLENAFKIMTEKKILYMIVTNIKGKPIGILDFFELLKEVFSGNIKSSIESKIEKNFVTLQENDDISAFRYVAKNLQTSILPVVNETKIVGVININEVLEKYYFKVENTKNKLENIIDNIPEAVCAVDKDGIVTVWNKSAEDLYDVPTEEIIGKKIENFFSDAAINIVRKNKKPIKNKYHSPRKGSYVVTNSLPICINRTFVGAVSTDRDITKIRHLSYESENAKKLKDYPLSLIEATKNLETENIKTALKISNNNKAKAAKMLNIPRSTLYYKMDLYNIK